MREFLVAAAGWLRRFPDWRHRALLPEHSARRTACSHRFANKANFPRVIPSK
jgi:hypothetical protein